MDAAREDPGVVHVAFNLQGDAEAFCAPAGAILAEEVGFVHVHAQEQVEGFGGHMSGAAPVVTCWVTC